MAEEDEADGDSSDEIGESDEAEESGLEKDGAIERDGVGELIVNGASVEEEDEEVDDATGDNTEFAFPLPACPPIGDDKFRIGENGDGEVVER